MIPKPVRAQIQEHTSMGYMLFYINENGDPIHHFEFDCDVAYHGLAGYAEMILSSLKTLDKDKFREFILEQSNQDDETEEF